MPESQTLTAFRTKFPSLAWSEFRGDQRAVVPCGELSAVLGYLRYELGFDLLVDITCVDYLNYRGATDRFGLVYLLTSTETNERLTLRVFVNDPDPTVPSAVPLWAGADWMEREVWDMFGIRFEGHPDLRRILLPEEFTAFPLRKDYPLQGRGERHNFPVLHRADA
ncbi:MAG TPA: NADH-quinone oxidoreductase subunit C [Pirellulales bacterium]|jgi:NADH-quinone oxidoreductase subunit C|nr:NADH-quinone oxidoreductase subunit C [Pirellulales bacterium]